MKTYKQKYQEIWNQYYQLVKELGNAKAENAVYKLSLESQNLFDPVKYKEMEKKLNTCIEGLQCIKQLSKDDTAVKTIAKEVLYQIGESETW